MRKTYDDWSGPGEIMNIICVFLGLFTTLGILAFVSLILLAKCYMEPEFQQLVIGTFLLSEITTIEFWFFEYQTNLAASGRLAMLITLFVATWLCKRLWRLFAWMVDALFKQLFHHTLCAQPQHDGWRYARYYAINCREEWLWDLPEGDFECIIGLELTYGQVRNFCKRAKARRQYNFRIPKILVYRKYVGSVKPLISRRFLEKLRKEMSIDDTVTLFYYGAVDIPRKEWCLRYSDARPEIEQF